MKFEQILPVLRTGQRVKREVWDGRGVAWIVMQEPPADAPRLWEGDCITLRTTSGQEMTWIPSQKDIMAEDWAAVDAKPHPLSGFDPFCFQAST